VKAPPPKEKHIVVYCHGGRKAPAACEKLLADGYKHVFVWGGIVNWPLICNAVVPGVAPGAGLSPFETPGGCRCTSK